MSNNGRRLETKRAWSMRVPYAETEVEVLTAFVAAEALVEAP
jgi:hypothetical protein